ncbi:FAD:protein FMN transferase [Streptacidiphilus jiangxiensis]|uniref:FAD:protein FMN transferase n=1 Tax=Streptacidiphilus jiangxiensis TaxID=235985 RepID=A0A1H7MXZ7_STRJI|nr:FAD:protein FMN transferase [Streptacidiphilus jiangxiensis]SEL15941.1 thiamine biosynthesis lipoprotein [Streptacidiphilus jiangxiensis]
MTAGRATAAAWRTWSCTVRLVVTDPARLPHCRDVLAVWLDEVDRACSRFREDSELVALDAAEGRPVRVGPVLAEALGAALRAAELTDGDVDPTVGSAMAALGYDRDFSLVERDGRPLKLVVRPVPGWRRIAFDPRERLVTVPTGVRLDLGATAKAWAADRAAATLAEIADCGVLVSIGGDTAVAGPAPDGGWRVRVQDRTDEPDAHAPHTVVAIRDGGLATSSTTARRWSRGGRAVHHLLDPRTGHPAAGPWRTVSVAAGSCLDANIASTAAMIRGASAPAWLERNHLPGRLVDADGAVTTVGGWPDEPLPVAPVAGPGTGAGRGAA